jgi:uncharacterized protein YbjT (DUF2867 family)
MSNDKKIILVTGVTGQQGGAVARHLLAQSSQYGWQVRGLTRNSNSDKAQALMAQGVEIVAGNTNDRASLDQAMQGVYGVFSVQGFWEDGVESELRQGRNLADAAKAANVQHFVYSSVGGAERNTGIPHFDSKWQIEQHIAQLGLPATILRPVEFMENFFWSRSAVLNGVLMSQGLRPERKKYWIAVDDIGAITAIAFANPQTWISKAVEIAGDALTEAEIAATLSEVVGRPVALLPLADDPNNPMREELLKMWDWFDREGYRSDIAALREIYPPLHTLDTWLRRTGWENAQPEPAGVGSWSA